ncbi:MAG: SH3 domain-containing protein [Chloroflexi bacterium]|nr:SH3 domain-containing protein [Chloroflexota bacterium]
MTQRFRVITPHEPEPGPALVLLCGERLRCERKKTQWEGWLWCITPDGRTGWVPEPWVDLAGDAGVMAHDYDAAELTVAPGDVLEGLLTVSSWLLAISPAGQQGWVPLECVEPV